MALPRYFAEIVDSQRYFCYYCDHRMHPHIHIDGLPTPRDAITKDHLKPRVYKGETIPENLVAACLQCNNLRGEIDVETFKCILEKEFKRNPFLWIRWHDLTGEELDNLKQKCITAQERRLRGKAKKHPDIAYIHQSFVHRRRNILAQA